MNNLERTILSALSIAGLLAIGALVGGYLPNPQIESIEREQQKLGVALTTINASDLIKDSRAVINQNFSSLNTSKLEASDLTGFGGFGNLTVQTLTATSTSATSTISWGLAAIQRLGIGSTATTTILGNSATSTFSCCITSGGLLSSNGITLTGGSLLNTSSATSTWPSSGLSVGGGGLVTSQGLTITGGNLLSSGLFTNTNAGSSTFSGGIGTAGLSTSNGLTLTGGNLTYSSANFVVQSTGNVGIGTQIPSFPLEVKTSSGASTIMIDGVSDTIVRLRESGTSKWILGNLGSDDSFRINTGIALGTNDFMTITSSGNLGIGTTTPGLLLSVAGNGLFGGSTGTTTIEHGVNLATKGGNVNIGTSSPLINTFGGSDVFIDGSAATATCYPATGATITVDWSKCNSARVTLSQAGHTVNFQGGTPGQKVTFTPIQDSTGNRTVTTYGTGIFFLTSETSNGTTSPGMTTRPFTANKMSCEVQPSTTTPATALQYECSLYLKAKQ